MLVFACTFPVCLNAYLLELNTTYNARNVSVDCNGKHKLDAPRQIICYIFHKMNMAFLHFLSCHYGAMAYWLIHM